MTSSSNAITGDTNVAVIAGGIVGIMIIVLVAILIVMWCAIHYYKKGRANHCINKSSFTPASNIHNFGHNSSTNPCRAQEFTNTRAIGEDSRICMCF